MRYQVIQLKDGWSKYKGDLAQWFRTSFTYYTNPETKESIRIDVEAEINPKYEGYKDTIKAEFSTVIVKTRWIDNGNNRYEPIVKTQIISLGVLYQDFYNEDYKNGKVDQWCVKAKKLMSKLIKYDIDKYHVEGFDYKPLWDIYNNWLDLDPLFEKELRIDET